MGEFWARCKHSTWQPPEKFPSFFNRPFAASRVQRLNLN